MAKNENKVILILFILLGGLLGGIAAALFRYLIMGVQFLFYGITSSEELFYVSSGLPWYHIFLGIVLGGVMVSLILYFTKIEQIRGHGMSRLVLMMQDKLRLTKNLAPYKALASAFTIGSGASAGKLEPIVMIGTSFTQDVLDKFAPSQENKKILLLSGGAAGLAGLFTTPLAATFFCYEVLLQRKNQKNFFLLLLSSFVGAGSSYVLLGFPEPFVVLPSFQVGSAIGLFGYIFLGIALGIIGLLYTQSVFWFEKLFRKIKMIKYAKPVVGAFFIAVIAIFLPQIMGSGNFVLTNSLVESLTISFLIILIIGKTIATSITIGSGGSGGLTGPALLIGGLSGVLLSQIVNTFTSQLNVNVASYGIIGVAGLFAAAGHAPITAVLLVFELTRDLNVLLPLVLVCVVSWKVASFIDKDSMYTKIIKNDEEVLSKSLK